MKGITPISTEQMKLLSSAVRIQILHLMNDRPRSAKQVADLLGRSPGSVHYHVQRLFDGGLITLESTAQINGITEKLYAASTTLFEPPIAAESADGDFVVGRLGTEIFFSPEELAAFKSDVMELVQQWERRQASASPKDRMQISIRMKLYEARNPDNEPSLSKEEAPYDDCAV